MLPSLIAALWQLGIKANAEEVADVLWLACKMESTGQASGVVSISGVVPKPTPEKKSSQIGEHSPEQLDVSRVIDAKIYPQTTRTTALGKDHVLPFQSPAAAALPRALSIGRALRSIMRRVPSKNRLTLDMEATVERIAEQKIAGQKIWVPVLRPNLERWLDIALIIDRSASMDIWRQTITELIQLLESHGAFRDVRSWGVEIDASNGQVHLYSGVYSSMRIVDRRELVDPTRRRLILVISDCVSAAWSNGCMAKLLAFWGHYHPIAVIQVFPERLWLDTALGTATPVIIHSALPGCPNALLRVEDTTPWWKGELPLGIAVPVVTLEPESIEPWVRMLAGSTNNPIQGFVLPTNGEAKKQNDDVKLTVLSAEQQLLAFQSWASPIAQQLASCLVPFAPLSLPVMRLIQGAILPESRQVHLAEVFLSRLLYRVPSEGEQDSDEIQYDFYPDVVDLLLDKSKGKQISEQISEYVVERIGQSRDFQALVGDTAVDGIRSFATLPVSILRRMGGSYAWLAERIERLQFCEPEMVEIQPGKFWMGSPEDEKGRYDDENQHRVIIKYSFAISKYPVTFDEYDRFAESTGRRKPRDENWGRGKRPVINVSWFDAVDYAKWLSEQTGYKYRLPTETEWEYTARANTAMTPNTSTPYYFGNTINFNLAHFGDRSSGTVEVGKFPANAWGLYDMHGNVWEWTCSKYSKSYEYSEQTDLEEYDKRYWRVCRGGAWNSRYERDLRSAVRKMQRPYRSDKSLGFRLVRVLNSGSDSNR